MLLIIQDDPLHKHRSEDSLVAYTFHHFCNDVNNSEYVAYMPMTKVAIDDVIMMSFDVTMNRLLSELWTLSLISLLRLMVQK